MQQPHRLSGSHALVIGLGVSGLAAARFLLKRGVAVCAVDQNRALIENDPACQQLRHAGVQMLEETAPCNLRQFDFVVASPGVPPTQPHFREAAALGIELLGEMELGCRELKRGCLGITGTNGKTTVALLTAHVLNHSGRRTAALGNIGTPLTAALDDPSLMQTELLVLELSSFQLETLRTRCLQHGALLNITPDHLERYGSMEGYAQAKFKMLELIQPGGKLFIDRACAEQFHAFLPKNAGAVTAVCYGYQNEPIHFKEGRIYYEARVQQPLLLPSDISSMKKAEAGQNRRSHDLENVMAAYGLCSEMGVSPEEFASALATFKKPSHRIEFVRSARGVHYYDDSKGTNIDAVVRAVEMFSEPITLIAGGVDKGAPYTPWISAFKGKVKALFAIGQAAPKIQAQLQGLLPVELCSTLDDAVMRASQTAGQGEVVLLSPGCSSFDMFKDYAHRGEEFKRIVNAL